MPRILVTGALGQIGSELSQKLAEKYGKDAVLTSDVRDGNAATAGTDYIRLDVTKEEALSEIVKNYGVDRIFHLAAILSATAETMPEKAYIVNSIGTFNVLKVSRENSVKRVMIPSSIAVYGPSSGRKTTPIVTPTRPESIYGITKVDNEMLAYYYRKKFGLDVRGIRFPGLLSHKTAPTAGTTDYAVDMIRSASEGLNYTCPLSPGRSLPMMYMPDALNSMLKLFEAPLEKLKYCTEYNISAFSFTPEELYSLLKEKFDDFRVTYRPDFRDQIAATWPESLDTSDAARDWGFKADYTLIQMIEDMVENFQKAEKQKV